MLPIDRIEGFVQEWMTENDVPGASIAITDDEQILYSDGFGSRNLETNEPATSETIYGFGSVTKAFTTHAVLQCVDDGRMQLEDSITAYTPLDEDAFGDVTLHELMCHKSGLPSLGTSEVLIARQGGAGELGIPLGDKDDFYYHLNAAADERDAHSMGRFMYCNEGFTLLADAVESVSEVPFPAFVTQEILDPLEMSRTGFIEDGFPDEDHLTPYQMTEEGAKESSIPVRDLSYGPGGLFGSVTDMTAWLRYQLTNHPELVDPELLDRAHEGHIETPAGPYGYGWRTRTIGDKSLVGHGGSIMVSTSYVGFLPEQNLGIAIACNTGPEVSPPTLGEGIAAMLVDTDPSEVVPYYQYDGTVSKVTGEYEAYRGTRTATVEDNGGVLTVTIETATQDRSIPLVPEEPTLETLEFKAYRGGRTESVEFVPTDSGFDLFIERMRFHQAD